MNLKFKHKALLMFIHNEDSNLNSRLEVYLKTLGVYPVTAFQDKLILMLYDDRYNGFHNRIRTLIECEKMESE